MFKRRVMVRHATGYVERRELKHEADFSSVLRDEFVLNMTDELIRTCNNILERKGERGGLHPLFA